jgi:TolB-like protein/Flp pilus assembly protein TadD
MILAAGHIGSAKSDKKAVMSFIKELKRRNVFRVGIAYLIVAWVILQIVDVVNEPLSLPGWLDTVVIVLLVVGLPVAVILAWAFDLTPQGMERTRQPEQAKPMPAGASLQNGFKLDGLEIRPLEGEISGSGGERHIHPKVMELLVFLAEKTGQVVQREEILDHVWGHRHGSDKSLTRCMSELRQALGDEKRLIETIPKRGYRLDAPIEALDVTDRSAETGRGPSSRPSIAVLPFTNMSGDPEQEYFSDGMTDDIITELSRVSGLFVIARNSTFTFKGRQPSMQEVTRELGARYVLQGSVRKAGNSVRVTAQLADGSDGEQIWAERYDRQLTDIFAVQDDLTRQIVTVLAVTLAIKQEKQGSRRATGNMEAYEYVLRGRELAWQHKRETGAEARRLLAHAIWLDPSYAAAYSWLSFAHQIDYNNQWSDHPDESLRVAEELARKAVTLDDTDAQAHFVLGEFYLWTKREHDAAMQEGRRAIDLEPNYSHAYLLLGHALHYAGRSDDSLEQYEAAMRLDPCYPDLYLHFLAQSYYSLGRYQDAIEALEERITRNPDTDISHVLLAACCGQLGMTEKAKVSWSQALTINPDYSLEYKRRLLPYKDPAEFEDFAEGLRKAGLPE